tara:strand:+ start:1223 stop:2143 length:921 start_codon:yes stop_codon:yes gene_type:complete
MRELSRTNSLATAVEYYKKSPKFLRLADKTKKDYAEQQKKICATKLSDGVSLGSIKLHKLALRHVSSAYEQWLHVGTRTANIRFSALSVVIKYAMQKEVIDKNPTLGVTKQKDATRKVLWDKQDIIKFLDVAYSRIEYKSIGLICHMAYIFGQRIGDMRTSTWDNIDFTAGRANFKQSKRGAEVHLPIPAPLLKMLWEQKEAVGWEGQDYICPRHKSKAKDGKLKPYTLHEISYLVTRIKKKASLRSDLWAMDLRRTTITQMVEGGADIASIMQVSGHQNPQSVKPYLVNTFKGACQALSKRDAYV